MAGPVSVRYVVNVLTFGNTISTVIVTGATIRKKLKHGFGSLNVGRRGFSGSFGNMVVDVLVVVSAPAQESVAVAKVVVAGEVLGDLKEYVMVTSTNFVGGGRRYDRAMTS